MTHYVVGYFDAQHNHLDIDVEAKDSWDAQHAATESNSYLNEHPNAIDSIIREG